MIPTQYLPGLDCEPDKEADSGRKEGKRFIEKGSEERETGSGEEVHAKRTLEEGLKIIIIK